MDLPNPKRVVFVFQLLTLLSIAPPTQSAKASVYAVQNKDGDWTVRKYNDGDPKVQTTRRDMEKTEKVWKSVVVKDASNKVWTPAGNAKRYRNKELFRQWKEATAFLTEPRVSSSSEGVKVVAPVRISNGSEWCGSGGCRYPKPGEHGRPIEERYVEGVDFNYGDKTEQKQVEQPNPDYLELQEPRINYSERAKNPGALPLIGSSEEMDRGQMSTYMRWLGFNYW